jgi:hypothetical protein
VKKQDLLHTALEVLNKNLEALQKPGESFETFKSVHRSLVTNVYPHLKQILLEGDLSDPQIMAHMSYTLRTCVVEEEKIGVSNMATVLSSPMYLVKLGELLDTYVGTPETTENQANLLANMTYIISIIFPKTNAALLLQFAAKFVRALIQCGKINYREFNEHTIDMVSFALTELTGLSNHTIEELLHEISPEEFRDMVTVLVHAPLTNVNVNLYSVIIHTCTQIPALKAKFGEQLDLGESLSYLCGVLRLEANERLDYADKLVAARTLMFLYGGFNEEQQRTVRKCIENANKARLDDKVYDEEIDVGNLDLPDGEPLSWPNLITMVRDLGRSAVGHRRRKSRRAHRKAHRKATRRFR